VRKTWPVTEIPAGVQRRVVRVLVVSQVLGGLGVGAAVSIGSVLATAVAGSPAWAGAGATLTTLGAAGAAIPLARLAQRRGRRPALALGATVAAIGSLITIAAAALGSFPLLLLSFAMLGGGSAVSLQARFAATDIASTNKRGRDLSIVVWSTTVGAVAGPNLLGPGEQLAIWLQLPELTGPFVIAAAAQLAATAVYLVGLRPDPLVLSRSRSTTVAPGAIEGGKEPPRPILVFAIGAIALSHAVMVSVMSMTPVHMTMQGATLTIVGFTISLHIAGMFALSPLFGWTSDRLGRIPVILLGQGLLASSLTVLAIGGEDNTAVTIGLVLLGLGWSAATVSASALVADLVTGPSRLRVQGRSDMVMNIAGATGGGFAGPVLALVGYSGLAIGAGAFVLMVVVGAGIVAARGRLAPA
jgi:MFS family permease